MGIGLRREKLIGTYLPALIMVILWMNGGIYPILLLPLLYVRYVEKRGLNTIGFRRTAISCSLILGFVASAIIAVMVFPIFSYYQENLRQSPAISLYDVITDIVWYPLYEEISYRGFLLSHLIKDPDVSRIRSPVSKREMGINLFQTSMFLSIHHHHVTAGMPLILLPVFLLGWVTGFIFIKTRNLTGCLAAHVLTNGFALLLRSLLI